MTDVLLSPRLSRKAVVSVLLGLLAPLSLATAGLPVLLLGFSALRDINRSDGRLYGRRLAIAGMVLGLLGALTCGLGLLAAVLNRLWETNNRVACRNNLFSIGQALNLYHEKHQVYPAGTVPNADLPPERRLSWLVDLLPYLPRETGQRVHRPEAVYEAIDLTRAWDAPVNEGAVNTSLRWFLCRSDPGATIDHKPGLSSYVGIAGVGTNAADLPETDPKAGVFGFTRRIGRKDVVAGLSFTMSATETTRENGAWAAGAFPTLRAVVPDQQPYIGPGRPFGGCHPGGLNILFLDGSVQFTRDSIGAGKVEAMATLVDE